MIALFYAITALPAASWQARQRYWIRDSLGLQWHEPSSTSIGRRAALWQHVSGSKGRFLVQGCSWSYGPQGFLRESLSRGREGSFNRSYSDHLRKLREKP
jgi:hypothetical protein